MVIGEAEVVKGFNEGFRADDDRVQFVTVQLEEVRLHPTFYVSEAVGECGVSGSGVRFDGDVDLDIVRIEVEAKTMTAYDVANGSM